MILPVLETMEPRQLLSIPTTFTPVGIGGTGTSYWAMVNPQNTNEIYLGSDMGEEWHTTDGAQSWVTMNTQTQIRAQALNSSVQYSGTAGTAFAIDAGVIKKTTDGGATWAKCAGWTNTSGYYASQVLADPNSSKLVVVENKWNYRAAPATSTWLYNVWFSSNAGQTFTKISIASYSSPDTNPYKCYLAGAFWDGNNIYMATNFGLYTSSNGGTSWSTSTIGGLAGDEGIYSFTGSRSGSTTRLYAVTWSQSSFTASGLPALGGTYRQNFRGLYSVDIGQANWTSRTNGFWGSGSTLNLWPRHVAMVDGNINKVWIGGGDANNYDIPVVYSANDAGVSGTWTRLLQTGYGSWNVNNGGTELPNQNIKTHQIGSGPGPGGGFTYDWGSGGETATFTVLRNNPNIMTFTDGGDAFMTTDGGAHWKAIMAPESQLFDYGQPTLQHRPFSSTINETSVWDVVWADPQNLLAPSTDFTAMQSSDGGTFWSSPTYTAGTYANTYYASVYDWRTGILYAVSSNKHDLYHSGDYSDGPNGWGGDYLVASYDKGLTWYLVHDFSPVGPAKALALDPTRPGRLYVALNNSSASLGGVYYTDNLNAGNASTWTHMANQPMRSGAFSGMHPEELQVLDNGDLVGVFAGRYDSNYNSAHNAGIWVLPGGNVNNAWVDRSGVLTAPTNHMPDWTMTLTVDPNDPTQNTWFASTVWPGTGWYGYTAIYKSTDRGATWSRWGYVNDSTPPYDDPSVQAWSIIIRPGTTEMFLGMGLTGLYYCPNYTAATPTFTQTGFPFGTIDSLEINPFNPDELWITTFGNGMYRANIGTTAPRPAAVTDVSASCAAGTFTVNWSGISGVSGYHLKYSSSRSGTNSDLANWTTVTLPAGQTTWSSSSLPSGLPVYFQVTGYNSSGIDAPVSNTAMAAYFGPVANVTAVGKGPSQVAMTWTDNAANEDNFEVQKSTDGVNWSAAGTAPANSTSFALGGLAANTQYYLRVRATISNSQGAWSTPAIARTNALTGLLASEDFLYGVGTHAGADANQGIGWAGPWTSNSPMNVVAGNLAAASASGLWTNGNHLSTTTESFPTRNLSSPVGGSGTLWASYLLKVDFGPNNYGVGGYLVVGGYSFGASYNSKYDAAATDGSVYVNSSVTPVQGDTVFLVLQVISGSPKDTINLYLNPTPGAAGPGAPIGTATVAHRAGSAVVSTGGQYYANPQFDEIRIGTTYASVAPIPLSAVPTNLTATAVSSTQVNLAWNDVATNETGYHIERSTDGLTYTTVQTLGANATGWNDTAVSSGTTYYYRASSYNKTGDSIYSNLATVTVFLPGDANHSGLVDQDDYKIWYDNYGAGTTWQQGNFKGYGTTDQADYKIWYDNYGASSSGGADVTMISQLAGSGLSPVTEPVATQPDLQLAGGSSPVPAVSSQTATTPSANLAIDAPTGDAAKISSQTAASPILRVTTTRGQLDTSSLKRPVLSLGKRTAAIAGQPLLGQSDLVDVLDLARQFRQT